MSDEKIKKATDCETPFLQWDRYRVTRCFSSSFLSAAVAILKQGARLMVWSKNPGHFTKYPPYNDSGASVLLAATAFVSRRHLYV